MRRSPTLILEDFLADVIPEIFLGVEGHVLALASTARLEPGSATAERGLRISEDLLRILRPCLRDA